jgi:amino acid transporter
MAARADDKVMVAEKIAPLLVARSLTSFDLIVIFVGIVLFITNSAGLQFAGPSVFIFWIVAFLTFLITGAFITAQLGRMFPEEGSLYVWTHKVLGPFWGFFAGFVAWWPGPLVMVAAGIIVVSFAQQIAAFMDTEIFTEAWQQGLVVLAVVWFGAILSLLRMRLTQNYVNLQFFFYAAAIFAMGLAGLVWLLKGNPSANSFAADLWDPFQGDDIVLGLPAYLTFYSFAVLALLGIEVPLNMGVEVVGGEGAIKKYLFWGCVIVMAAYLWTTWGNMVTVSVDEVNGVTGGAQGVGIAMGDTMGIIVAVILLWFFVTASMVYNYSFARLLFVSGLEKRLPPMIGRVNRNKVPANAVLLQTILASIVAAIIFFVIGEAAGADPNKPYFALLAGLTIIWCISTALLFLDIFFARRADPERFEQARRVNEGFLYACGAVGFLANLAAVFFIFTGTWYPPGFPTLAEWNTWLAVIAIVSVIAGITVWFISEGMRGGKTDVQLVEEIAKEVGAEELIVVVDEPTTAGSAPGAGGSPPA